ncbi:hypothetical protein ACGH2B_16490 [Streptomyces sp. BBFR2]
MSTRSSAVAFSATFFLAVIPGTVTAVTADTAVSSHVGADDVIWGSVER